MKAVMKSVAALAVTLAWAPPGAADPVRITAGSLAANGSFNFSPLTLSGTMGFSFVGNPDTGVFEPSFCVFVPCEPGDSMSLLAHWSGNDLIGTATVNGQTYERVGSFSNAHGMSATFSGSMLTPVAAGASAVGLAPFSFEGQLFIFDLPNPSIFHLSGEGVATASFVRQAAGTGWYLDRLVYDFTDASTVPEPSTLALIAAGGAFGAWRARKKGRRKK